ncbi:MAG: nucleotide exchange factor GrpE [Chitinophagaceae bacterium]
MNQKEFQENSQESANGSSYINETGLNLGEMNTDENMAGTNHLNEALSEDPALEKLQAELAEQKDKYLRLFAEFDNAKRRNAKERIELIQTAGREVISSLLDVMDDCDRAEKVMNSSDDVTVIKEGVQLVFNKLRNTLQAKGLKPMETVHTEFDADKHEAITEIPAPTAALQGKVIDEVTKGYYLGDKIIRFAKVVVGK